MGRQERYRPADYVAGGTNPLNSKYGTRAGFGPVPNTILYKAGFKGTRARRLNDAKDLDLYMCPGDTGPRGADWLAHTERSSFDHLGQLAANVFMTATRYSNSPYMRPHPRANACPDAAGIGRWAWAAKNDWCDFLEGCDIGPTKNLRWHGEDWTYNRSFADAHGESQRIYVAGSEDSEGYAFHYRSEKVFEDPDDQETNRASGAHRYRPPVAERNRYEGCVHSVTDATGQRRRG